MGTSTLIMILCIIAFVVIPSLKDRAVQIKKLILGPAVFVYLFYSDLGKEFSIFPVSYYVIAAGVMVGILLGLFLRKSTPVRVDKTHKTIFIPGGYSTLLIFVSVFSIHFVVGYLESSIPGFFRVESFGSQIGLMLLALTSFLSVGANGCLLLKYLHSENRTHAGILAGEWLE